MSEKLSNPDSVVYRFGEPRKGYAYFSRGEPPSFGWIVEVGINDGRIGETPYAYLFQQRRAFRGAEDDFRMWDLQHFSWEYAE